MGFPADLSVCRSHIHKN